MITTTYTCDKCKHAQNKAEQMWQVSIILKEITLPTGASEVRSELWCRQCCEKYSLLPRQELPSFVALKRPSIEALIKEILERVQTGEDHVETR